MLTCPCGRKATEGFITLAEHQTGIPHCFECRRSHLPKHSTKPKLRLIQGGKK